MQHRVQDQASLDCLANAERQVARTQADQNPLVRFFCGHGSSVMMDQLLEQASLMQPFPEG
jgi:hypothetical protein